MSNLFAKYKADPGAIRAAAKQAGDASDEFTDVATNLQDWELKAAFHVEGDLEPHVAHAANPVISDAHQLAKAAMLAQAVMNAFAGTVEDYNSTIEDLNQRYECARGLDFGIMPDQWADPDPKKADNHRHQLLSNAKHALLAELQREEAKAEQKLDDDAADQARSLDEGPSLEKLIMYTVKGDLPRGKVNRIAETYGVRSNIISSVVKTGSLMKHLMTADLTTKWGAVFVPVADQVQLRECQLAVCRAHPDPARRPALEPDPQR